MILKTDIVDEAKAYTHRILQCQQEQSFCTTKGIVLLLLKRISQINCSISSSIIVQQIFLISLRTFTLHVPCFQVMCKLRSVPLPRAFIYGNIDHVTVILSKSTQVCFLRCGADVVHYVCRIIQYTANRAEFFTVSILFHTGHFIMCAPCPLVAIELHNTIHDLQID